MAGSLAEALDSKSDIGAIAKSIAQVAVAVAVSAVAPGLAPIAQTATTMKQRVPTNLNSLRLD
ncbi:18139_t:CDS:1, partial [Funneliformis geosporum]